MASLLLFLCSEVMAAADHSRQLLELRAKMSDQQGDIVSQQKTLNAIQDLLKKDELALASSSKKLRELQSDLKQNKATEAKLVTEQSNLEAKLKDQSLQLSKYLRAAYIAGDAEAIKLLLKGQDLDQMERNITYYQYLGEARVSAIKLLQQNHQDLLKNKKALDSQRQKLQKLVVQQQSVQNSNKAQQEQRMLTLKEMNKALENDQLQVKKLLADEQSLQLQINQIIEEQQVQSTSTQVSEFPLVGLASLKGKLNPPTKGKVLHSYGSNSQGSNTWKGIVFDAHPGQDVLSIADGKVVFSNWMRGYGLVIAIDHGKEYMSMYGYNQSLQHNVGDFVRAGDLIAKAGNSGGQQTNSLYFQMRYKGKTENPKRWLKP
ncbi:murein hydrolase activator EnvC family protein [Alginatibacterium sediminis]|nr:peptidoglycan DD-metalloendopeptidase family protein [Alginatibacterium sediminis]